MHSLEHVYQALGFFIYKIRGISFVLKKSMHMKYTRTFADIHTDIYMHCNEGKRQKDSHQYLSCYH